MASIKIQKVTPEEKDELNSFVERYYSLFELKLALEENSEFLGVTDGVMYNQVISELEDSRQLIDNWWEKMKEKYSWQIPKEQLRINFATGEVYVDQCYDVKRGF